MIRDVHPGSGSATLNGIEFTVQHTDNSSMDPIRQHWNQVPDPTVVKVNFYTALLKSKGKFFRVVRINIHYTFMRPLLVGLKSLEKSSKKIFFHEQRSEIIITKNQLQIKYSADSSKTGCLAKYSAHRVSFLIVLTNKVDFIFSPASFPPLFRGMKRGYYVFSVAGFRI